MVKTSSIKFLHPLLPIVLGIIFTSVVIFFGYIYILRSNTVTFDTYQGQREDLYYSYLSNIEEFNANIITANKVTDINKLRDQYINLKADWETINNHLTSIKDLDSSESKKILPSWASSKVKVNITSINYEQSKLSSIKETINTKLSYINLYLDVSDINSTISKISITKREKVFMDSINNSFSLLNTLKSESIFNSLFYSKEYSEKLNLYLTQLNDFQNGSTRYTTNTLISTRKNLYLVQGNIIKEIEREINK